jgi:hypothetical protein
VAVFVEIADPNIEDELGAALIRVWQVRVKPRIVQADRMGVSR